MYVRRTRVCSSVCASVCAECVLTRVCVCLLGPAHVAFMLTVCRAVSHLSATPFIFTSSLCLALPCLASSRPVSSRLVSSRLTHPHQSVASNPYLLLLIARQLPVAILPITFFGLVSLKQPLTASERIEQPQPAPGSCLDGISIWMWILACMLCLSTQ